jgi:hypothetical protein
MSLSKTNQTTGDIPTHAVQSSTCTAKTEHNADKLAPEGENS